MYTSVSPIDIDKSLESQRDHAFDRSFISFLFRDAWLLIAPNVTYFCIWENHVLRLLTQTKYPQ